MGKCMIGSCLKTLQSSVQTGDLLLIAVVLSVLQRGTITREAEHIS